MDEAVADLGECYPRRLGSAGHELVAVEDDLRFACSATRARTSGSTFTMRQSCLPQRFLGRLRLMRIVDPVLTVDMRPVFGLLPVRRRHPNARVHPDPAIARRADAVSVNSRHDRFLPVVSFDLGRFHGRPPASQSRPTPAGCRHCQTVDSYGASSSSHATPIQPEPAGALVTVPKSGRRPSRRATTRSPTGKTVG